MGTYNKITWLVDWSCRFIISSVFWRWLSEASAVAICVLWCSSPPPPILQSKPYTFAYTKRVFDFSVTHCFSTIVRALWSCKLFSTDITEMQSKILSKGNRCSVSNVLYFFSLEHIHVFCDQVFWTVILVQLMTILSEN